MHVVIDARFVADGGIGTYVRHMTAGLARLRPSWTVTALGDPAMFDRVGWGSVPNLRRVDVRAPMYSLREQLRVPRAIPRDADLFWAPHYNAPAAARCPVMVTIHDVCHLAIPEALGSVKRAYARLMLRRVRDTAAAVLFDSEFSRAEMARLVGTPVGASAVVPGGVDESWSRERAGEAPIGGPYLAYVGNWKTHKNVPMLLRAFARVQHRIPHRLALVGRREGLSTDPRIASELARLGDRVVVAGEVSDADVRRWVQHADALVTASLYEGFGLPPLEAMAAGRPCMVSRAGSLPEVCGDAAHYCDPRDEDSVAAAIVEISTNDALRDELVRRGRERVRAFRWDASVAGAATVMERVAR